MPTFLSRRSFLAASAAACSSRLSFASSRSCLLISSAEAERIRDAVAHDSARASILRANADAALRAGPWSVTFHRPNYIKADLHEYYSEAPYFWPDPAKPGGPFLRKDGERYPDRYTHNRKDLGDLCEAVLALGMAARFLGDSNCAARAAKVLSVWFLDEPTRMNPNLEYGQAIRGVNTGRGTGIIDTVSFIHLLQGIALMEDAGSIDKAVTDGVRRWFVGYANWMNTSKKGTDEKKATNNHGTWWTAQLATYATFTGDDTLRRMAFDRYRTFLVPGQVQPDGSCPREEARTKSLSYSSMNLDGFSVLCRLGQMAGQDLWRFRTPQGNGIEKSFHYLLPYVLHPATWRKPQIAPYEADSVFFPGLAGKGLESADLLAGYRALPRSRSPWVQFIDLAVRAA